jgi:UDP-glucuronate decarboxylase
MHPYDGRVVSNFIRQALRNEAITLFGTGQQTRSFCYRDDLIDGLVRMMNTEDFIGPVNIGNPDEFTIKELADLVIELTQSRSELKFLPLPPDDPARRRPDIALARSKLDWQPSTPLRDGLIKTIDWFRSIDLDSYIPPTPNYH